MRIASRVAGVAGAAALSAMAMGGTALADSADNDGINMLDGNNISAVPIGACNNNVGVLGAAVPVLSPQGGGCVNAPLVDHPQAG